MVRRGDAEERSIVGVVRSLAIAVQGVELFPSATHDPSRLWHDARRRQTDLDVKEK